MKIASRLSLGFGILILLVAGVAGHSFYAAKKAAFSLQEIERINNQMLDANMVDQKLLSGRLSIWKFLALGEENDIVKAKEILSDLGRHINTLAEGTKNPERKENAQALLRLLTTFNGYAEQERQLKQRDPELTSQEAKELLATAGKAGSELSSAALALAEAYDAAAEEVAKDAAQVASHAIDIALIAGISGILIGMVVAFTISRSIALPVKRITANIGDLSEGNYDAAIAASEHQDEISVMARAAEQLRHSLIKGRDMEAEVARQKKQAEADKKTMMHQLADNFEQGLQGIISAVAAASTQLYQTAEEMSRIAESADAQSTQVAGASHQTAANVQTVATAVEEMSAAVKEITAQIAKSMYAIQDTVEKVAAANQSSEELNRASESISTMAQTIEGISGQINLLALNATIESARAGEAGKGFAVVASEVKTLANQTQRSTVEIKAQISGVQTVSGQMMEALRTIREAVAMVNQYSTAISAAVEEQSAVNQEIARSMADASSGVEQITQGIGSVSQSVKTTTHSTRQVLDAAKMLSQQSEQLNHEVRGFLDTIRAA